MLFSSTATGSGAGVDVGVGASLLGAGADTGAGAESSFMGGSGLTAEALIVVDDAVRSGFGGVAKDNSLLVGDKLASLLFTTPNNGSFRGKAGGGLAADASVAWKLLLPAAVGDRGDTGTGGGGGRGADTGGVGGGGGNRGDANGTVAGEISVIDLARVSSAETTLGDATDVDPIFSLFRSTLSSSSAVLLMVTNCSLSLNTWLRALE
jgi:hypothetical protein